MADSPITDEIVRQLITGEGTEDLVISDLADCQLYGWKYRRRLTNEQRESAIHHGFDPVVYQSIYWWTIAGFPVNPRQSYYVLPYRESVDGLDTDRYRCLVSPQQAWQVATHFGLGIGILVVIGTLIWWKLVYGMSD